MIRFFGIQFTNVPSDPMAPKKKQTLHPELHPQRLRRRCHAHTMGLGQEPANVPTGERHTQVRRIHPKTITTRSRTPAATMTFSVENYLAGLEDEAARIITDLIRFALAPLYPPPNFKKKECLARFLWAQHMRSPAARAEIVNSEETKQMYHDARLRAARPLGADRGIVVLKNGDPAAALARASKRALMMTEDSDAVHYMRHMKPRPGKYRPPPRRRIRHKRPAMPDLPGTQPWGKGFHGGDKTCRRPAIQTARVSRRHTQAKPRDRQKDQQKDLRHCDTFRRRRRARETRSACF